MNKLPILILSNILLTVNILVSWFSTTLQLCHGGHASLAGKKTKVRQAAKRKYSISWNSVAISPFLSHGLAECHKASVLYVCLKI